MRKFGWLVRNSKSCSSSRSFCHLTSNRKVHPRRLSAQLFNTWKRRYLRLTIAFKPWHVNSHSGSCWCSVSSNSNYWNSSTYWVSELEGVMAVRNFIWASISIGRYVALNKIRCPSTRSSWDRRVIWEGVFQNHCPNTRRLVEEVRAGIFFIGIDIWRLLRMVKISAWNCDVGTLKCVWRICLRPCLRLQVEADLKISGARTSG